jgi:hypothetical protein
MIEIPGGATMMPNQPNLRTVVGNDMALYIFGSRVQEE